MAKLTTHRGVANLSLNAAEAALHLGVNPSIFRRYADRNIIDGVRGRYSLRSLNEAKELLALGKEEAREEFSRLVLRYVTQGLRPVGHPARGERQTLLKIQREIFVSRQTIGQWTKGNLLPSRYSFSRIESFFFGEDDSAERRHFRKLYYLATSRAHMPLTGDMATQSVSPATLAELASPSATLSEDGRLHATPNKTFDSPEHVNDLVHLPMRQIAIIQAINTSISQNAPKYLINALENYQIELKTRGVQPILGLLKDMGDIIDACTTSPTAQAEWMDEGLTKAFDKFKSNHELFIQHFPLDAERDEMYSRVHVDEDAASGSDLYSPFTKTADAFGGDNNLIATDDFVKIVGQMGEFAKIISSIPSQNVAIFRSQESQNQNKSGVSAKKRFILTGFGFFERAYNLLSSSATLAGAAQGNFILEQLRASLSAIGRWIGLVG